MLGIIKDVVEAYKQAVDDATKLLGLKKSEVKKSSQRVEMSYDVNTGTPVVKVVRRAI